jgi:diguanylate cyclase (GGDEF)-like protein
MALLYIVAGKLSFLISQDNMIVSIVIFASEGFALAGVIIFGRNMWIGIFLGQFILAITSGLDLIPSIGISAINSLEAILGYTLFHYFKLNKSLTTLRDVLGLLVLIVFILQPFSALLGNLVLLKTSVIQLHEYSLSLFSWWFGNTMGQILFTHMSLLFYAHRKSIKFTDMLLVTIFFGILSYLLQVVIAIDNLSLLLSSTLLFIILLSIYKGVFYGTYATTVITVVTIYATHLGSGVLASDNSVNSLIDLNFYLLAHIMLVLIIGTLFSEKEIALKRLETMAHYDFLTGLPNRNSLKDKIKEAIAIADSSNNMSAICFIDIDGFKQVNDTLGHYAGDEVLKSVVYKTEEIIRDSDSMLRLGGDEFILIFPNINSTDMLDNILKRISDKIREPMKIENKIANVSLSIGIALYPKDTTSVTELINYADKAMYEAKNRGKDCFVYYKFIEES